MEFRTRLRQLREECGYTSQASFAKDFGVAQTTVAGWEGGKREPPFSTMMRLADFFRVSVDFLLGRTDIRQMAPPLGHSSCWDGSRLLTLRERFGEKPRDTAEALGTSTEQYLLYEQNKEDPPIWVLIKLADHFGTTIDRILGLVWELCDSSGNPIIRNFVVSREEQRLVEQYRLASNLSINEVVQMLHIMDSLDETARVAVLASLSSVSQIKAPANQESSGQKIS